jgi:hypothetical protein
VCDIFVDATHTFMERSNRMWVTTVASCVLQFEFCIARSTVLGPILIHAETHTHLEVEVKRDLFLVFLVENL